MSLIREQRDRRENSVPDVVMNIARENAAIHDVIHRYIGGHIITRDEMLCQCIIVLNTNFDHMLKSYLDCQRVGLMPMKVPFST